MLASSLDYEQTLARSPDLAVPRLADWCGVALPIGDRLQTVAVAHVDPAKVEFARRYQERYPTPADAPTAPPRPAGGVRSSSTTSDRRAARRLRSPTRSSARALRERSGCTR